MTTKLVTLEKYSGSNEIHKAGCADIEKKLKVCSDFQVEEVEATTLDELAQSIVDMWENDGELACLETEKARLLLELKPCTGLRR